MLGPLVRRCLLAACLVGGVLPAYSVTETPPPPPETEPKQAAAAEPAPPSLAERIAPTEWLVLPRVGDYQRAALHRDPIEHALAIDAWDPPSPGDEVTAAYGEPRRWRSDRSSNRDLAGGYAYAEFESPEAGVLMLEAAGCAAVWLNGEWYPGDPYGVGWFRVPAPVLQGKNRIVAHLARPTARPRLVRPTNPIEWVAQPAVAPSLSEESGDSLLVSVPLRNASDQPLTGCRLRVAWQGGEPVVQPLRTIESLLVTPIVVTTPPAPADAATLRLDVLPVGSDDPLASVELPLAKPAAGKSVVHTFRSAIDGSVQPYAVAPPRLLEAGAGVLMTLHDAGQTAEESLAGVDPLDQHWRIAPGGRGAWGFDWEDWSRLDALEALDDFLARHADGDTPVDPDRVAVIGRGMGGHGALRLATLHPDRFAAAAMLDPWLSFYTLGRSTPPAADASPRWLALTGQASANDPLRVLENLAGRRLFIQSSDAAAPAAAEARYLRRRLGEFHTDYWYTESPPDADLATWLLGARRAAIDPDRIEFATPDLSKAAGVDWATIEGVTKQGQVARLALTRDRSTARVQGATTNVNQLRIDFTGFGGDTPEWRVKLDQSAELLVRPQRDGSVVTFVRDADGAWTKTAPRTERARRFGPALKTPQRFGGLKSAFNHLPQLVYGTGGSDSVQRWAAAKARYDAHLFLYRGAGRLPVLSDREAIAQLLPQRGANEPPGSLVLYGNETTNRAMALLRRDRAVRLQPGVVRLGGRPESGDDVAALAVRPAPGSDAACIALIGGASEAAMRLTTRLRYFWSGVEYPDVLLFDTRAIGGGEPLDFVRAAGYFGFDWTVGDGVAWRDLAL